jgi:hypothetical protein
MADSLWAWKESEKKPPPTHRTRVLAQEGKQRMLGLKPETFVASAQRQHKMFGRWRGRKKMCVRKPRHTPQSAWATNNDHSPDDRSQFRSLQ